MRTLSLLTAFKVSSVNISEGGHLLAQMYRLILSGQYTVALSENGKENWGAISLLYKLRD